MTAGEVLYLSSATSRDQVLVARYLGDASGSTGRQVFPSSPPGNVLQLQSLSSKVVPSIKIPLRPSMLMSSKRVSAA